MFIPYSQVNIQPFVRTKVENNLELRPMEFRIVNFPDGSKNVVLSEFPSSVEIHCSLRNSDDLIIYALLVDALRRHRISIYIVQVYYLYGARQDRVEPKGSALPLSVVGSILSTARTTIRILDPHTDAIEPYITMGCKYKPLYPVIEFLNIPNIFENLYGVEKPSEEVYFYFPDQNAYKKYSSLIKLVLEQLKVKDVALNLCYGEKIRDSKTGKITDYKPVNLPNETPKLIIVVDDICDGGTTFVKAAEVLELRYPKVPRILHITHPLFTKNALEKLVLLYDKIVCYQTVTPDTEVDTLNNYSVEGKLLYNPVKVSKWTSPRYS